MIKIKNPFSHNRFSTKEKIQRKISAWVIPVIKIIPDIPEDFKGLKGLSFLQQSLRSNFINTSTRKPEEVDLELLSVNIAEYIPVEEIEALHKGLKKLFKKNPTFYNQMDLQRIEQFCNPNQSIHGRSWIYFGQIDIKEDNKLSEFVKSIRMKGIKISSSSIGIEFFVTPSDSFQNNFKEIVCKDISGESVLNITFKNLFRFWGRSGNFGEKVKRRLLEDLLIELKWRTMKEINKYFKLYFFNNNTLPPSIEVYKKTESSSLIRNRSEGRNVFWESVGLPEHDFYREISKSGFWELYTDEDNLDNSIKLTCNSLIKKHDGFYNLDHHIAVYAEEFSSSVTPIAIMRAYVKDLSKKLATYQNKTFKSLGKEKINYDKLINIRFDLERSLQILKRFKNETDENYFNYIKREIKESIEFEPTIKIQRAEEYKWNNFFVDNTVNLIDMTDSFSKSFVNIIDETARLTEIKVNNSLRKRTFWLTIFTVFLTIVATVLAVTSIYLTYLQLNSETQNKLISIFSSVKNFFS